MNELAAALRAHASSLAADCTSRSFADPFWDARFGPRGRRYTEEDARHHLDYLATSLESADPSLLAHYARWLRSVLVTRGMCSLHLVRNLETVSDVVTTSVVADAATADQRTAIREALLGAGRALRYESEPAASAEALTTAVLTRATSWTGVPHWSAWTDALGSSTDLAHHWSYLTDAIALQRPTLYSAHIAWLVRAGAERGLPRAWPDAALASLEKLLIEVEAPQATADSVRAVIREAQVRGAS